MVERETAESLMVESEKVESRVGLLVSDSQLRAGATRRKNSFLLRLRAFSLSFGLGKSRNKVVCLHQNRN